MLETLVRAKGEIIHWIPKAGFCFIKVDGNPDRIYFGHIKQFHRGGRVDEASIQEGDPVEFSYDPQENPPSPLKPRAFDIRLRK